MNDWESRLIVLGTIFVITIGVLTNVFVKNKEAEAAMEKAKLEEFKGSWACFADSMTCPDGTVVGRVPPYCHFQACGIEGK